MLPTVKIMTDNGPVVINESDYDPAKHTLADGSPQPSQAPTGDGGKAAGSGKGGKGKAAGKPTADDGKPSISDDMKAMIKSGKFGAMEIDGRFFAVDLNNGNAKLEFPGIDSANGYKSNQEAWNALIKVQNDANA